MILSLSQFEAHLLAALANHPNCSSKDGANLGECADSAGFCWQSGWIDHVAKRLEADGYIEIVKTPPDLNLRPGDIDRGIVAQVTSKGIAHLNSEERKDAAGNRYQSWNFFFPQDSQDWIVLSALLSAIYNHENEGYLTAAEIAVISQGELQPQDVQSRLDRFSESGYVKTKSKEIGATGFRSHQFTLTAQGTWFVVQHSPTIFDLRQWSQTAQLSSEMEHVLESIWEWDHALHDQMRNEAGANDELRVQNALHLAPASDRIVSLNHNSDPYKAAVIALEKTIIDFREDHRLDNDLGKEKSALLKTLQAGRELLDDTRISVNAALLLIIEPLKHIVQKYDQALVAASATAAINVVLKLLGLV